MIARSIFSKMSKAKIMKDQKDEAPGTRKRAFKEEFLTNGDGAVSRTASQEGLGPPSAGDLPTASQAGLGAHLTEEFMYMFAVFDVNGDHKITDIELGALMEALGVAMRSLFDESLDVPSPGLVKHMINEVDPSKDFLYLNEFLNLMARRTTKDTLMLSDDQIAWIESFFSDGKSLISRDVTRGVVEALGYWLTGDELGEMIRDATTDLDGRLQYDEFVRIIASKPRSELERVIVRDLAERYANREHDTEWQLVKAARRAAREAEAQRVAAAKAARYQEITVELYAAAKVISIIYQDIYMRKAAALWRL